MAFGGWGRRTSPPTRSDTCTEEGGWKDVHTLYAKSEGAGYTCIQFIYTRVCAYMLRYMLYSPQNVS